MGRRSRLLLAALFVCGCGDSDPAGTADGATASDASSPEDAVAPPDVPWLADGAPPIAAPEVTPCPEGWRAVPSETGPVVCDPYPETVSSCGAGEAHFPGEPGCTAAGSPCPAGEFSDVLPADRNVVYVQPGGTGDGMTPTTPYGSPTSFSVASLPMDSVIALSRGSHVGPVRLVRGIALWGACAAETTLTTSAPSMTQGVVTILNARGEVHDLTVADSARPGVWIEGAVADGVVEGVVVTRAQMVGVLASDGARLAADTVVVRETGGLGRGLNVQVGASATLSRAVFETNREIGTYVVDPGTTLTASDVVVRDTQPGAGMPGWGITVYLGATLELSRALVDANRDSGLGAAFENTVLTVSDVVVRGTEGALDGTRGDGLRVVAGASAEVSRVLLDANRDKGMFVDGDASASRLSDVIIRDTRSDGSDVGGRGLSLEHGGTVDLARALIETNRELGIHADDESSMLTLSDLVVRGTESTESDGLGGWGLNAEHGATVEVSRALFEANRELGTHASDPGTTLTMSDVVVRDTMSQAADGSAGRALNVVLGATGEVNRALFERNRDVGVTVHTADTTLTLLDVVVRDTVARARDETGGRGLGVGYGATAQVSRALFERNREVDVFVGGAGSQLTLFDATVRDTESQADLGGHGVGSYEDAALSMTRFLVSGSELCGVHLGRGGQMDLSNGEVRGCAIGACLQVDPYDTSRLTDDVRYIDNGTNLQATTLPVPEPDQALGTDVTR